MGVPELRWESSVFHDPNGGSVLLWPYLPCIRMPAKMRPRVWDGLALLSSADELISLKEEEEQDKSSPGIHMESALASGTTLGMLVRDLSELDVEGPSIPDPERIRLLRHAENSRGGMPIYAIEPGIDDTKWADWQSRWADEQVRFRNLLATIGRSRRWSKVKSFFSPQYWQVNSSLQKISRRDNRLVNCGWETIRFSLITAGIPNLAVVVLSSPSPSSTV